MKTQNPISDAGSVGSQNVAGYVGEIAFFADDILRKNHVWADGAPINATTWPDLAAYAEDAGWEQNSDGKYLTPNLAGRVLINKSATHAVNTSGGTETVSLTSAQIPNLSGSFYIRPTSGGVSPISNPAGVFSESAGSTSSNVLTQSSGSYAGKIVNFNVGEGKAHSNMQPYYTVTMQIRAKVDKSIATVACPWEVGDILETKNPTPPNQRWPGTEWEPIETFLLGASESHAVSSTGGSETVTLTVNEMPSHNHDFTITGVNPHATLNSASIYAEGHITAVAWDPSYTSAPMNTAGNGQAHNNMPPYTAVYIWERTA